MVLIDGQTANVYVASEAEQESRIFDTQHTFQIFINLSTFRSYHKLLEAIQHAHERETLIDRFSVEFEWQLFYLFRARDIAYREQFCVV